MTIDPPAGYVGDFLVRVTASDGLANTTDTFAVSVTNSAPRFAQPLADVTMSHNADTCTVNLGVSDADGDAISYTVSAFTTNLVAQRAHEFASGKGLVEAWRGFGYNHRGHNEKYFADSSDNWYFLLPNGELHRWPSGFTSSTRITTLSSEYWADPYRLFNAAAPQLTPLSTIGLSVSGGVLTIDPPAGYTGAFLVQVTASDGIASARDSFEVRVGSVPSAPTATRASVEQAVDSALQTQREWRSDAVLAADQLWETLSRTQDRIASNNGLRNSLARWAMLGAK